MYTELYKEKKKTNPKADCLLSICDALEITPEQLLTGKGIDPEYKDADMDYEVTRADIKILKQIHSLGDEKYKRLMAYIFKNYGIHFIFVLVCIVLSVVASIQGTLFMQRLIDDYIMPMIGQETPDFGNLFREIVRVAGFYLVGVAATYAYNRIMVTITQGTLKNLCLLYTSPSPRDA